MKSNTSKCLGILTGVMRCIVPFQLVQADDQEAIVKFSGAWFRPWSELGGPAIKVEKASGGTAMVVTVGNLPARVVEVDGSRLLCVTAGTQDGKSCDDYFELQLTGNDQAYLYFCRTEPGQNPKLPEQHETVYRGH